MSRNAATRRWFNMKRAEVEKKSLDLARTLSPSQAEDFWGEPLPDTEKDWTELESLLPCWRPNC